MAWTVSSRCGLIISKRIMSVNSYGSSVGHQQMAKFFESMLLALQFSVTLMRSNKINNNPVSSKQNERKREILDEMLEDEFEYVETDGCQFLRQEIPQWQQTTAPIRCHYKTKRSRATVLVEHVFIQRRNRKTHWKSLPFHTFALASRSMGTAWRNLWEPSLQRWQQYLVHGCRSWDLQQVINTSIIEQLIKDCNSKWW